MPSGDPLAPLNSLNAVQWRASVRVRACIKDFSIFGIVSPSFYSISRRFIPSKKEKERQDERRGSGKGRDGWISEANLSPDAAGEHVLIRSPVNSLRREPSRGASPPRFVSVPSRSRLREQDSVSSTFYNSSRFRPRPSQQLSFLSLRYWIILFGNCRNEVLPPEESRKRGEA